MWMGLIVIVLTVLSDQISKFFVYENMVDGERLIFGSLFNLVKVWNTGVSFSLFNGHGQTGAIILTLFAVVVAVFLFYWMLKETNKLKIIALAFIIGGALGNVIDRIRFGAVLDFLDFHYKNIHWPAFNVADSFICIGVFILICMEFFDNKKKRLDEV